jgi:hypothetical protein
LGLTKVFLSKIVLFGQQLIFHLSKVALFRSMNFI